MYSESQRSLKQSLPTAGQNVYCYKSIHSKLGFTLCFISMIIIFYIGYPNIFEVEIFFRHSSILAMFEHNRRKVILIQYLCKDCEEIKNQNKKIKVF